MASLLGATPPVPAAELAWVQRYSQPVESSDAAVDVAVDGVGNVVVFGYTDSGVTGRDLLTIKYSNAGAALWTNRYDGPANGRDWARAVVVDSGGNVLVTASSLSQTGGDDFVTIKYSSAGAALWTNSYAGPVNLDDIPRALVVDGNGNAFVTGVSPGVGSGLDYATVA